MPSNWYTCQRCGWLGLLTYTVAMTDDPGWPPVCGVCSDGSGDAVLELAPQPGDFSMDLRTDGEGSAGGNRPFQKFTTVVNGRREVIDSLHTLRQVDSDNQQRNPNRHGEPGPF